MSQITLDDYYVASCTPEQFRAVARFIQVRGLAGYDDVVEKAARTGLLAPVLDFIPERASDEAKMELMRVVPALVASAVLENPTEDDFVKILTSLGLSEPIARNMVTDNIRFEDYDASAVIKNLASVFPSFTGGIVSEVAGVAGDLIDKIVPDSWQSSSDLTLVRFAKLGEMMRRIPDHAALTTKVIEIKQTQGDDTVTSLLHSLSMLAAGVLALSPARGVVGAAASGLGLFGARRRFTSGSSSTALVPSLGDYAEFGDYEDVSDLEFAEYENESDLVVLPEAGDLLVHPSVVADVNAVHPEARQMAAQLFSDVVDGWRLVKQGRLEEGGFFKNIFRKLKPLAGKILGGLGTAVGGAFGGPLGAAAGAALGGAVGKAISKGGSKKAQSTLLNPRRAQGTNQASRPVVKGAGQQAANILDAARAPAMVRGLTVDDDAIRRVSKLISKRGSAASPIEIKRALIG